MKNSYMNSAIPFVGMALASTVAATAANAEVVAERNGKPNVVIIYADDMGYADLSCYGETRWKTKNLDNLAENGVQFTDFYSASPISSPSRAGLLTGRYPARMGIQGVFFPESYTGMPQSEVTIAEMLREQGYKTSIVGKWHLGHRERFLPLQQGFDEYFGIPYSNDMTAQVYMRGNEVEQFHIDQNLMIQTYTKEATGFIRRNAGRPFFLYMAHNMMHVPIHVSDRFRGKSGAGIYGDALLELDWSVGEIVRTLEELNLDKNTIIVFASDNGPWLQEGPLGGTALPLREGKSTDYEGGVRVPCIAYWKDHFTKGKNTSVACMLDWFPTIAEFCGGKLPEGVCLDGYDISKVLMGTGKRANQDYAYFKNNKNVTAYRSGDWKIELPIPIREGNFWRPSTEARDTVLVNLREDIGETTNLYYKYPQKAKEMLAKLKKYADNFGEVPASLVQNNNHQLKYLNNERKRVIKEAQNRGIKPRKNEVQKFIIAK